ncbi:MAG: hypothetical protein Q9163_006464 [Psora crenata]
MAIVPLPVGSHFAPEALQYEVPREGQYLSSFVQIFSSALKVLAKFPQWARKPPWSLATQAKSVDDGVIPITLEDASGLVGGVGSEVDDGGAPPPPVTLAGMESKKMEGSVVLEDEDVDVDDGVEESG